MSHIKLYNSILIFLCITSNIFSVLSELSELSKLEDAVYFELRCCIFTVIDHLSYSIKLQRDMDLILYGYLVPSAATETKTDMYMSVFYIYTNCSFAEWLQNKLFKFIEKFPIFYQTKFQNTNNNEFNKPFVRPNQIDKLIEIDSFVKRSINILLPNFVHLTDPRDYDTSLLKTMLLLHLKIHFLTLPSDTKQPPSDDVVVRSILKIMNLIQTFMATNCDVHTYNKKYFNDDTYFIKSSHFFDFWITKSADKNVVIEKVLKIIDELGLEDSNKYCNTDQMLLINVIAENPDHPVLWEISHAEVYTNSKTIKIYQLIQKIEKRECDLELIFWYQESIFYAIVKLTYNKIITALQQGTLLKPEDIVKSIPKFIELPTDVTDYFTSGIYDTDVKNEQINNDNIKEKLIKKITDLRDSITNIILETYNTTENQDVSNLDEFTTYMNSNSEKFYCYISVCKFLRKEFTKYYIPFIRDVPKVEHIVYEDVKIDEIVQSDVDDKLTDSSRCQYVRDLYSLCLEATTFLKMAFGKEDAVRNEYAKQASIILTTIRKRSIDVIERCTYKDCRDLLKVSYHIYVVLNPKHTDHLKSSQAPMFMSLIMSILNSYGIDHCSPPKFNFLLLNSTYLEAIGNDDVLNKRLNSFVQSLEIYRNIPMVANYSTFLNIDNFYKTYLEETALFTKYKHKFSFFYKGERKYIDEIYKNITAINLDPSHVFKLYDIYFKFVLVSVFYKVCVFAHYSVIPNHPKKNLLRFDDCDDFHHQYKMLLNIENFPSNLSLLVSIVDQFSSIVYDLCYQRAEITKNYLQKNKSKGEIPHFKVFGRECDSDNLYLKVGKVKEHTEKQFEKFGIFITKIIEEIQETPEKPKTITEKLKAIRKPIKTQLLEKVFEDMTVDTCELVKAANKMLTKLIINV
ncbi:unnamed protein product [Macrosiphum euphorbiae]|uniref:Uncharacterized protein n=1 Tax=Macrosiphum euphorbiae TaxID=13131 RepID=A0AAV0XI45_9HEMI|nr:unnamed protein product [Macrosiphum euphorbiae]